MNSDDVRREEAAQLRDGALPQGPGVLSLRPGPAPRPPSSELFADRVLGALEPLLQTLAEGEARDRWTRLIRELISVREENFRRACRRAIQAERDYQVALNTRAGSRYGAERRQRAIDVADRRRAETAREIDL